MKVKLFLLFLVCNVSVCFAQFKKAWFELDGFSLPYQIAYPKDYDATKKYPLIVFLHGVGERGDDNERQVSFSLTSDFLLSNTQEKYPAITIVPQCASGYYWSILSSYTQDGERKLFFPDTGPSKPLSAVMALIEDQLLQGNVDPTRVYVGGLSMGGMGTLELVWRMPTTFAAIFPICGAGDASRVSLYAKNTAVWLFHGEKDTSVETNYSRAIYAALQTAGCDVKYTEYPGVGHNSWDNVFQEPDLFAWLWKHKK